MAFGRTSNSRSRWKFAVSLVCVFAILMAAHPCGMCTMHPAMNHAMAAGPQDGHCCSSPMSVSAARACCDSHSVPAVSEFQALDAAQAESSGWISAPVSVDFVRIGVAGERVAPPPLLQTILRI